MQVYKSYILIAALFIAAPFLGFAQDGHEEHDQADQHQHESTAEVSMGDEISAYIEHHQLDPHDFHLFSDAETGAHYGFPLPVILWDEGLHVFMSSAFHHDDAATVKVENNGVEYVKYHEKIYRASDQANDHGSFIEMDEAHHAANIAPLDFSITKGVFSIMVISLFIFWLFRKAAKVYVNNGSVPKGIAGFLEPLILFVRDEIAIPNIGEKHYRKYMGYLLTVFFFIWIVNLFGLTPLGINITGNIAVTFALALITFIITQATAKSEYWKHIFWMPGVPVPMKFILAPIELLGVIIKPFALMIRLFANISAGHIVLMSLIGLLFLFNNWFARGAFLGLTFFLSLIELLVAFLQAYIFTMLTALYFGSAVAEHEEH